MWNTDACAFQNAVDCIHVHTHVHVDRCTHVRFVFLITCSLVHFWVEWDCKSYIVQQRIVQKLIVQGTNFSEEESWLVNSCWNFAFASTPSFSPRVITSIRAGDPNETQYLGNSQLQKLLIQWNPVNTDTKGTCHSVRIIWVSVLSGLSENTWGTHVLSI